MGCSLSSELNNPTSAGSPRARPKQSTNVLVTELSDLEDEQFSKHTLPLHVYDGRNNTNSGFILVMFVSLFLLFCKVPLCHGPSFILHGFFLFRLS